VPRETTIESASASDAETRGWFCRRLSWRGRRDAPDHLFIKDGRTVWMEFKRPRAPKKANRARTAQEREHAEMRAAGAEVYVVSSVEQALAILEGF
jgi:hypothetical protein